MSPAEDEFKDIDLPEVEGGVELPVAGEAEPEADLPSLDDELPLPELADGVKDWIIKNAWLDQETVAKVFEEAQTALTSTGGSVVSILRNRELLKPDQIQELEEVERLNDTLPRFVLEQRLGAGAVGAVYLASDKETGKRVALKFLHEHIDGMEEHRERFEREAGSLAQLDHPVIPALIDHSKAMEQGDLWIAGTIYEQPPYLAMEFVEGMNLRDLITKADAVPEPFVLHAAIQVAKALDHAWTRAGIIHRDIKPENIIIEIDKEVPVGRLYTEKFPLRIIDFGLAKVSQRQGGTGAWAAASAESSGSQVIENPAGFDGDDSGLTMTGAVVGTPRYMAPEQVMGEEVDWAADLYSVGATMFHLLTGQPPFTGSSPTEVMMAHIQSPVPDPSDIVPSISNRTVRLVMRALDKKAKGRFPTYLDFIEACERALNAMTSETGVQLIKKPFKPQTGTHRKPKVGGTGAHTRGTGTQRQRSTGAHTRGTQRQHGTAPQRVGPATHRIHSSGPQDAVSGQPGTDSFPSASDSSGQQPTYESDPFAELEGTQPESKHPSTDCLSSVIRDKVRGNISSDAIPNLTSKRVAQTHTTSRLLDYSDGEEEVVAGRPWMVLAIAALTCTALFVYKLLT